MLLLERDTGEHHINRERLWNGVNSLFSADSMAFVFHDLGDLVSGL